MFARISPGIRCLSEVQPSGRILQCEISFASYAVSALSRIPPVAARYDAKLSGGAARGSRLLEPIALLSGTCPTISGYVFLDENDNNPALEDNGLLDPNEKAIPNAPVELLDSTRT